MKKWLILFVGAFLLNALWENLHSIFYTKYRGGSITEFILLRAALVDAFYILFLALAARWFQKPWMMVIGGFLLAVGIEVWALGTSRWAYASSMPLLPILDVGLLPVLQLAATGYLIYLLVFCRK